MDIRDNSRSKINKSNINFVRFIISLLCCAFVLIGTIIQISFAYKRGNPTLLFILYYVALGLNSIQMIIVLANYILNKQGIFTNVMKKLENVVTLVWAVVIFAEFISASILFNAFRIDFFTIFLTQCVFVILMLYFSRKIDYAMNSLYNKRNLKKNLNGLEAISLVKKRELSKIILYFLVGLVVFVIQIGVLLLPKMPPKIDDIFSENRLLEYEYYSNIQGYEDGYYVVDIYYGINDKIVIPETYNNKPVVGIKSNAISDIGNISSLQLGEYDNNGVLHSNIKTIEKNSIKLDKITTLTIPSSVTNLGENAIVGKQIKTLYYESDVKVSMSSFSVDNLEEFHLSNDKKFTEIELGNKKEFEVIVPVGFYNQYREKYFVNRSFFDVENRNNFIVIDFETNCDYYLESKVFNVNDAVINIDSLKNEKEETSSLINDTAIYNNNNYSINGYKSKPGFAFRGWYRDAEFTKGLECNFNQDLSYKKNVTIYAKWCPIKEAKLDWSNYYPYGEQVTTVKFVVNDDVNESIKFPKLDTFGGDVTRKGFDSLNWKLEDNKVEETFDLLSSNSSIINIKAEWILAKPKITYTTYDGATQYNGDNHTFVFDESQFIDYQTTLKHLSDEVALQLDLSKKQSDGSFSVIKSYSVNSNEGIFNYKFHNHADTGLYRCELTAKSETGETSKTSLDYSININKKDIDISSYQNATAKSFTYNGTAQRYEYPYKNTLPSYIEVQDEYSINKDDVYDTIAPRDADAISYPIRFKFQVVGTEKDNYEVAYKYSSLKILPKEITLDWNQTSPKWDTSVSDNFKIEFNGQNNVLTPTPNSIFEGDIVGVNLSNIAQREVGHYTSVATGLNNKNYKLANSAVCTHNWEIIPTALSTTWANSNCTYNGQDQYQELKINGFQNETRTSSQILDDFIFNNCEVSVKNYSNGVLTLLFKGKDAKNYDLSVLGMNNENYSFTPTSHTFTIAPKNLTVNEIANTLIYNGQMQSISLQLSGYVAADKPLFNINPFVFENTNCDNIDYDSTTTSLKLYGVNAISFSAKIKNLISTFDNSNYKLDESAKQLYTFSIGKKQIGLDWSNSSLTYNGTQQLVSATVKNSSTNICSNILTGQKDIINVSYENDKATNCGNYIANATIDNANYVLDGTKQNTWSINKKTLSFSKSNTNQTYDGQYKDFVITISGFVANELLNIAYNNFSFNLSNGMSLNGTPQKVNNTYKITFKGIDAKTYTATILSTTLENYTTTFNKDYSFTINKKKIEYDWDYSSAFTYDKTARKVSPIFKNLVTRVDTSVVDTTTATLSGNIATYAGNYVAILESLSNTNYYVDTTNNTCLWSISPKVLELSWSNTDTFTYNGYMQTRTASATNSCSGDSLSFSYTYKKELVSTSQTKNVGNYSITISDILGTNSSSYVLPTTNLSREYSITPKTLTVTITPKALTYNGTVQEGNRVTLTGFVYSSDADNFSDADMSTTNVNQQITKYSNSSNSCSFSFSAKNAGTYSTIISSSLNDNYVFESKSQDFTIKPLAINVSWSQSSYMYDGEDKPFVATVSNKYSSDTINLTYSYSGISYTGQNLSSNNMAEAGEYIVTIKAISNNNYTIDGLSTNVSDGILVKKFVINKRGLSLSYSNSNYVYNGNYQGVTLSISNYVDKDKTKFTTNPLVYTNTGCSNVDAYSTTNNGLTGTLKLKAVNAGTYNIIVSGLKSGFNNSNYKIDESATLNCSYIIKKSPVTLSWTNNSLMYDGTNKTITPSVTSSSIFTNIINATKDVVNLTTTNNTDTQVGTYTAEVIAIDNENYELPTTKTKTWSVTKKPLTFTWNCANNLVYDGINKTATLVVGGITASDINSITISWFTAKSGSMAVDSFVKNSDNTITLSFSKIDSGNYYYQISSIESPNYSFDVKSYQLNIAQKVVSFTWNNLEYNYDGTQHEISCVVNGLVNRVDTGLQDVVTATLTNNKKTSAGSYTAKVSALSGTYSYNYKFDSNTSKTWKINTVQLTSVWKDADSIKNDGSFIYDGETHTITLEISGFLSSEYSSITSSKFELSNNYSSIRYVDGKVCIDFVVKNAASYSLSVKKYNLPNYEFNRTSYLATIKPKTLTVAWSTTNSFVYNGQNNIVSATITGFENQEQNSFANSNFVYLGNVTPTLEKSSGAIKANFGIKNVNTYNIGIKSLSSSNYTLVESSKTYSITKKTASISWSGDNTYTYNGSTQGKTLTISGLYSSDVNTIKDLIGVTPSSYSISTDETNISIFCYGTNAGSYNYNVSFTSVSNYQIQNTSCSFSIAQKELTVQWITSTGNLVDTYDGNNKTVQLVVTGFVNSDTISKTNFYCSPSVSSVNTSISGKETCSFAQVKNAKTYNYSITGLNNVNYRVDSSSFTYEIKEKPLTISVDGESSYEYDEQTHSHTITISGFTTSDMSQININSIVGIEVQPSGVQYTITKEGNDIKITYFTKEKGNASISINSKIHKNYSSVVLVDAFIIEETAIDE